MKHIFGALALCAATALPGHAHEYWLEAENHQIAAGETAELGIFVGTEMTGSEMPYFPRHYRSLELFAADGEPRPIEGRLGARPAIVLEALEPGAYIVAQVTSDNELTYREPGKFASFLASEGLSPILDRHVARGLPETGFSESYSRAAKALLSVGGAAGADRSLGLPVELIALNDVFEPGATVELRYDFDGAPQPEARINLFHRAEDGTVTLHHLTTDAEGRATVPAIGPGFYLANAVFMEPREPVEDGDPVWHSHWASLTWTREAGD
ncbi:DUF4198 domain-containing protein [Roseobacter sp. HKCCA0434]|uniref:DUF4198 domain-containing protein n=1 Tax=Roseobacter sp. HKCCA0434 TaxID=3079297 RepID=UPI002905AF0A|nr:DUF4198 domain-containing protein [Roseobacter sp. HKCCA0434]